VRAAAFEPFFSFRIHLTFKMIGFCPVLWFWIRIYRISRIFKYGRWLGWRVPQHMSYFSIIQSF